MRFVLLIFMLLMSSNCLAYSWDLMVVYPDKEQKDYTLGSKVHKLKAPLLNWACEISKLDKQYEGSSAEFTEIRQIACSNKKAGLVTSIVVCSRKNRFDVGTLTLVNNDQYFIMRLRCQ